MTKNNQMRLECRNIKRCAALLLGERGNLLRLSGAFLCSLAMVGTAMHLFESVCYFIFAEEMPLYLFFIEIVLIIMLALPLCMGLSRMAYRMCCYKNTEISELFCFFDKKRLSDAYKVSFTVLGAVALQLALAFALGWIIAYAMDGFGNRIIPDETYMLTIVFFLPISGMLPSVYLLPNAFFKSENASEAFALSSKSDFLLPKEIIGFNMSFIPLILLSVLSFGILFIVYAIPLYLVAVQLFIIEKSSKKEN